MQKDMWLIAVLLFASVCAVWGMSAQSSKLPFVTLPEVTVLRGNRAKSTFDVSWSIAMAQKLHPSLSSVSNKDRLAVVVVFNYELEPDGTHPRLPSLVCALNNVYTNIAHTTPVDVFMWMAASQLYRLPSWFRDTFPDVKLMPVDPATWVVPSNAGPVHEWAHGEWKAEVVNYHVMGRWRLIFPHTFVRAMGYEYMLQIDDDTFVIQPINFNIVQDFRSRRIAFAHRDRVFVEKDAVTAGLPELVKYWMVTRNYLSPAGPLYENVATGNITGLHGEGWNRQIVSANFMLFDVGFWFEPAVQDFLQLVYATAGDLNQRWLEQGVINMVRLLFLPDRHVHTFPQHQSLHQKVFDAAIFRLLQCDAVAASAPPTAEARGLRDMGMLPAFVPAQAAHTVRTIEFLVVGVVDTIGREREDFALFRWRYNTSSCGGDTAALNEYVQYSAQLAANNTEWDNFGMREQYAAMVADDARYDAGLGAAQCAEVRAQQLRAFVEFFSVAKATETGPPLRDLRGQIYTNALAVLQEQLATALS